MEKILLIDDDVELTETLSELLKSEGYEVNSIDNLGNSKKEIARYKPDLVILDVMFPENPAGGFDTARKIREDGETSKLPVILLTAVNQEFPMDFSANDIDPDWMPVQEFIEKTTGYP